MVGAIGRFALARLFPGVISEVHSGLGNQMFQYAAGRSLADRLGVDYALCVKDFSQDYAGRKFELDSYSIRAGRVGYWATSVFKDYAGWRGMLARMADSDATEWWQKRSVQEPNSLQLWPEMMQVKPPILLTGYWQSEEYFKDNRLSLLEDFKSKTGFEGAVAELAEALKGANSISVHVRRGDYAHHPEIAEVQGVLGADYYRDAVDWMLKRVPEAQFYVFSDEPEWVEAQMSWPAGTTIVKTLTDAPASQDLDLMRLCQHQIIANSSYSWWGAWLGEREGSLTVAPKKWSKDPSREAGHIVPARWVRL